MVVPRTGMATILRALLSMPPLAVNDCLDNSKEWDPPHRTLPHHPIQLSRVSSVVGIWNGQWARSQIVMIHRRTIEISRGASTTQ